MKKLLWNHILLHRWVRRCRLGVTGEMLGYCDARTRASVPSQTPVDTEVIKGCIQKHRRNTVGQAASVEAKE